MKPGDLVLVKADAWKGKRKIKDRWDEETWEVSWQIATDVPSYEPTWTVTNPLLKPTSHHIRGWHSLMYGNLHAWYRCTSPTPCKTTSLGGDKMMMPQEQDGKASTQ